MLTVCRFNRRPLCLLREMSLPGVRLCMPVCFVIGHVGFLRWLVEIWVVMKGHCAIWDRVAASP